jgi:hypothetical protein
VPETKSTPFAVQSLCPFGTRLGQPSGLSPIGGYCSLIGQGRLLFAALRSEQCRLQFWTAAGGTSYGKLTDSNIDQVLIPVPPNSELNRIAEQVRTWAATVRSGLDEWSNLGSEADRKPIINSSGFGLIATDDWDPDAEDGAAED